jgi:hypothetical protein
MGMYEVVNELLQEADEEEPPAHDDLRQWQHPAHNHLQLLVKEYLHIYQNKRGQIFERMSPSADIILMLDSRGV